MAHDHKEKIIFRRTKYSLQSPKLDLMKPSCVRTWPYKTKISHILEGEKGPITSQQSWETQTRSLQAILVIRGVVRFTRLRGPELCKPHKLFASMKSSSFRRIDIQKKQSRRIVETGQHCRGSMKHKWEHSCRGGVIKGSTVRKAYVRKVKAAVLKHCFSCCKLANLGFGDDIVSQFGIAQWGSIKISSGDGCNLNRLDWYDYLIHYIRSFPVQCAPITKFGLNNWQMQCDAMVKSTCLC